MEVIIQASVSRIPDEEYAGREDIESVYIPSTVSSVGKRAFRNCINLVHLEFEEGASALEIDEEAFSGCTSLASVTLPGRTSRILSHSFSGSGLRDFNIGGGGDFLARGFYIFENTPSQEVSGMRLESERQKRADRLYARIGHEHTYPENWLVPELRRGAGCGVEKVRTGLVSLYELATADASFNIGEYSAAYRAACTAFAGVADWNTIDDAVVKDLVSGASARHVANLDFGNIIESEWNQQNVISVRDFCSTLLRHDVADAEELRPQFIGLFTRMRHQAAFNRQIAMAWPDHTVPIPSIGALIPLYEWLTGLPAPTVEQSRWYSLSSSVRQTLGMILQGVDTYAVGAFSWYLAEAFRSGLRGDALERQNKMLGWMRDSRLIRG